MTRAASSTRGAAKGKPSSTDRDLEPSLYAKRQKVYPREVHGLFASLRFAGVVALMGIYYFLPWLQWKGQQAVLLDLPARKFHFFELTFWPQDFIYLTSMLIIAALSLFFFTALAGRLWCGYACPQTVWTEVFLWIERRIEGDRGKQMKLDRAPWSGRKAWIKGFKHFVWIALSLWTGYTFVGYFTPIRELGVSVLALQTGPWETFWLLFYGFATYGNAGWLREQVCIYMCPYARFQSAMFDKDTMIISYDRNRGEPRGPRKKSADPDALGLGACVDCTICVQVCPTGIDIRNGLQYECIGCAACVDACDDVMDRMNYPRGLIRYTTENALEGKPTRVLRPRVVVYGLVLLALLSAVAYGIATRVPVDLDVIRDRNTLFRETPEGLIENVYTLKLLNMDRADHRYSLSVSGLEDVTVRLDDADLTVPAGEVREVTVRLQVDPYDLEPGANDVYFTLTALDDESLTAEQEARFVGPRR
ncbi:MAG: cytochrome c oxidase accessory protein CcoG [Gammaproteobacteria bacterium]|nr:cytochrome c oxidase accessory protein CcoG [Gammaproteobacteria bacterium]